MGGWRRESCLVRSYFPDFPPIPLTHQNNSLAATATHIANISNPTSVLIITQTLTTLSQYLLATLSHNVISVGSLVEFIQSLLQAAPSSSAQDPRVVLADILVDIVWLLDVNLEDAISDVVKALKAENPIGVASLTLQKATLESDKKILGDFVKTLVVRIRI